MNRNIIAATALVACASATFAQQTFNPQTFGHWVYETRDGFKGSVTIGPSICQYTLTTSFSSAVAYCRADWNPYDKTLGIFGSSATTSTTVPDYQPDRSVTVSSGTAQPLIAFMLDNISPRKMMGHIIGVGENAHVILTKH